MNSVWYDIFLEELYKRYPQKSALTEALMDLLSIEREATYRRLRKDVMFPVEEMMKIASAWGISLDAVIGSNSEHVYFQTYLLSRLSSSKDEAERMRRIVQWCDSLKDIPDLEFLGVCNKIPHSLSSGFPYLQRLQLLKWSYWSANDEILSFSEIAPQPANEKLALEYYQSIKNLPQTSYIWDYMLFNYVISDVRYFHSVYLITDEEKELIKNQLYALIDYMLKVATKGCWPETGKKVNLYISQINIDTNYSYFYSEKVKLCLVHAFVKSEIYTTSQAMAEHFKQWMQSKKRASVLISEADERSRIGFFRKQRLLIDEL